MDTTKEYILMSEKAVEIQKIWQKKISNEKGGHITNGNKVNKGEYWVATRTFWNESDFVVHREWSDVYFWLPRQEQLQEMVLKDQIDVVELFQYLATNVNLTLRGWSSEATTLRYVMENEYGKSWNGEEWR